MAALLLAVAPAVPSAAQPGDPEAQLEQAEEDATQSAEQLDQAESRLSEAEQRLRALDERASRVIEEYNRAQAELDQVRGEMTRIQQRVRSLERRADRLRTAAEDYARSVYKGGQTSSMEVLLEGPDSMATATLVNRIADRNMATTEELEATQVTLRQERAALEDVRRRAEEKAAEVRERRRAVEQRLSGQQEEVQRLRRLVSEAEDELAADRQAADSAEQQIEEQQEQQQAEQQAPAPQGSDDGSSTSSAPAPVAAGAAGAVEAALSQVGTPYVWGGSTPGSGFDCSGLTSWAWAQVGVSLPHSSQMQYAATERISSSELRAGDLIFYGSPIHHVAMYTGSGGEVVEAPYSGASVRVRSDGLSRSDIVGYGRP